MQNLNLLISGQTASGKTSFAKILLALARRAIVFDPIADYTDGIECTTFEEFARVFLDVRDQKKFRILLRFETPIEYETALKLLVHAQKKESLDAVAVFVEEAWTIVDESGKVWPILQTILRTGRRQRISIVTITQTDVDVPTIIRRQSFAIAAFLQFSPSADFRSYFKREELEKINALEPFNPTLKKAPEIGVNFLVYPRNFPIVERWKEIHG